MPGRYQRLGEPERRGVRGAASVELPLLHEPPTRVRATFLRLAPLRQVRVEWHLPVIRLPWWDKRDTIFGAQSTHRLESLFRLVLALPQWTDAFELPLFFL
jgi:hypothetical protein